MPSRFDVYIVTVSLPSPKLVHMMLDKAQQRKQPAFLLHMNYSHIIGIFNQFAMEAWWSFGGIA